MYRLHARAREGGAGAEQAQGLFLTHSCTHTHTHLPVFILYLMTNRLSHICRWGSLDTFGGLNKVQLATKAKDNVKMGSLPP